MNQRLLEISVLCYLVMIICSCSSKTLMVNNALPRRDVDGKIVDAHDGRIIQFGNHYYWYGTRYGTTNGFTEANEYVCYSSPDMQNWKLEGPLLPSEPKGVYYRPHVVYNAATKKYVLWYNWYPKLWNGQFGVAVSDRPMGPFAIVNNNVPVKHSALGVGDLGVFVDEDRTAYLSYNTINGHKVSVEKLDADYTSSSLQGSDFIAQHSEAGAMFKRNGLYYLLTDYTCCFCTQGSGAQVFTANSPLGPYTYRQNINRYPGAAAPLLTDGNSLENQFETLSAKEGNGIEVWLAKPATISSLTLYQFTGNRPGQCGEVDNPAVHEPIKQYRFSLEYFAAGEWRPVQTTEPSVSQQSMLHTYAYNFSTVKAERIRIKPLFTDTLDVIHLSEVTLEKGLPLRGAFKTSRQDGKPIIAAQQAYVMELTTNRGGNYVWMGDLWGSASDNVKGHDFYYWSAPLEFYENGLIRPIEWRNNWQLKLK